MCEMLRYIKSLLADDMWDPSTSKSTRMIDLFLTFRKLHRLHKLQYPQACLFPPTAGDKLSYKHLWPEGIHVFEREGKRYIYFRDLEDYEFYVQIQEGDEHLSEKRAHAAKYLRVMKCKED